MIPTPLSPVVRHLRRLAGVPSDPEPTDAELLNQFLESHAESAFSSLVERHGGMVLRTCRRVLPRLQDAEDAFQATFLTLARHASSLRKNEAIGSWLHRVAFRIALRSSKNMARRTSRERQSAVALPTRPEAEASLREFQTLLDQEVQRLGEKYRAPFVLCCLEGYSHSEAARELGWKEGTVSGRLSEARRLLRERLQRRGVNLTAALVAMGLAEEAAAIPGALARRTITAALGMVAGGSLAGVVTPSVAALVDSAAQILPTIKIRAALALMFLISVVFAAGAWDREVGAERIPDPSSFSPGLEAEAPVAADEIVYGGIVLDADGKPAAGAKVYFHTNWKPVDAPRTTTDPQGRFTFRVRPEEFLEERTKRPGIGYVVATAPSLAPDWTEPLPAVTSKELILRLVRDDVPIQGRLLTLEGLPVAKAKVFIPSVATVPGNDLTPLLQGQRDSVAFQGKHPRWHQGPLPNVPSEVVTDGEGRFRITGVGRERIVRLEFVAEGLHHTTAQLVTRDTPPITVPGRGATSYLGAHFDQTLRPGRTLVGTVRDKTTGKPIPNVGVNARLGTRRVFTNASGQFELPGCGQSREYTLHAQPEDGSTWFLGGVTVPDNAGDGPITADIELVRGIPCRGRVLDAETGQPVRATVSYWPIFPNPNTRELPGTIDLEPYSTVEADAQGAFTCVVLPGPGTLTAQVHARGYSAAHVDPFAFFHKDPKDRNLSFGNHNVLLVVASNKGTRASGISQASYQGITLLDPEKTETKLERNILVRRERLVAVSLLDPEGKPLTGARVLSPGMGSWTVIPGSTLQVPVPPAMRPQSLQVLHDARRLIAIQPFSHEEKGPLTLRLRPWAVATGRLLTSTGKPAVGAEIHNQPASQRISGSIAITDSQGRFRLEPLLPEVEYTFGFTGPTQQLMIRLSLKGQKFADGENRDLGDLKLPAVEEGKP